ncbi:MAG TPA: hypothetical protein PKO30_10995 [Prolixibacteraceae bacterium]|nr:hypothetical protein [Prolixibacteraceae bacterium]
MKDSEKNIDLKKRSRTRFTSESLGFYYGDNTGNIIVSKPKENFRSGFAEVSQFNVKNKVESLKPRKKAEPEFIVDWQVNA